MSSAAAPAASARPEEPGLRAGLSLHAKATIALIAFALYLAAVGGGVSWQRSRLTAIIEDIEAVHRTEATLARVNTFSAHTVLKVNESYYLSEPREIAEAIAMETESIGAGLRSLGPEYPAAAGMAGRLEAALAAARQSSARSSVLELRAVLQEMVATLDQLARQAHAHREVLWTSYRSTYDSVTLLAAVLALGGLLAFGSVVTVFVRRLVWDLRELAARSVDIVRGYRGQPLAVARSDEVGALMDSVNRMQLTLRERENQIEVARQQRFHQEKMSAVGSLVAAVAHEINNPIAAIEGVAESIRTVREGTGCPRGAPCAPQLILEHTRRIVGITRQLSRLSSPASREPEWIDLNSLVRATTTFISYDRRFRGVRLEVAADASIPAVCAVADHVTQTLMNLLINAADALAEAGTPAAEIRVATAACSEGVCLEVRDNGPGMAEEVLARAFEEGYTTKPTGSGIGLFMCKTLMERGGGRIAIDSAPGRGTRVAIVFSTGNSEAGRAVSL